MSCYFQTPLPEGDPTLNGKMSVKIFEVGGTTPTFVIGTDQDWYITTKWEWHGAFVPMIAGSWTVAAFLESIGTGPEYNLPSISVPVVPGQELYSNDIKVAAGTITKGPYKLVVSLDYIDAVGNPGPVAGVCEGPILKFYEP